MCVNLSMWQLQDPDLVDKIERVLRRAALDANKLKLEISGATIWRWLSEDAIRPFYPRSWVFPRDPDFAQKASRVLELYEGSFSPSGSVTSKSPSHLPGSLPATISTDSSPASPNTNRPYPHPLLHDQY